MRFVGAAGFGLLLLGIAEVVVFILVAQQIGVAWALGIGLAVSLLGGYLVQREGVRGWRRFRVAVAERRPGGAEATDGLVGIAGALLLAIPGFISGAAGLLLLFPPVRALARTGIRRSAERRIPASTAGDLFGPKRVRREQPPAGDRPPASPAEAGTVAGSDQGPRPGPASGPGGRAIEGDVIEGEIIDPRP